MVKEYEAPNNNASSQANTQKSTFAEQPQTQQAQNGSLDFGSLGATTGMDRAFGWQSLSSMAADFVSRIAEINKNNPNAGLNRFKTGVVEAVSQSDFGSAAYVALQYGAHWLYGIVLFEKGDSMRVVTNNNVETYYTVTSLVNQQVLETVVKSAQDTHGISNLAFMALNSVPDLGKPMDDAWALQLMGQMLTGIAGRFAGVLGDVKLSKSDRFNVNVADVTAGVVLDSNAHPQRANFAVAVNHQQQTQADVAPTLLSDGGDRTLPKTVATGFVNLRFTGLKAQVQGVTDLKQLQGEVVVSLVDSQMAGSKAPYERQLLALAAFADIAQVGGWRDVFKGSLNNGDRKFSAVASYLNWGGDKVDVKKLDGNKDAIDMALDTFAPPQAALVVSHRAGNGLGGLSTLLAEIATGNVHSLGQLLNILDAMFPGDTKFRNSLATALGGVTELKCSHIIAAAVPTISGVYTGTGEKRSAADMDLVSVLTHLGDKQSDVYRYMYAQSYSNRQMDDKAQRIYLLKLAAAMYGGREFRGTGESLDMAVHPVFAKTLLERVRGAVSAWQLNGVQAHDMLNNSLFTNNGGESFVLSGSGNGGAFDSFGLNVTTNSFTL
ncbi:hypothetical protein pEaSNUABM11_00035 [Erwinia phage pEa_SNUABM_11]|nr:hypothetical protein pEaSNUABM11_00035 [Erwinia phage pEa_SNUABM_11]